MTGRLNSDTLVPKLSPHAWPRFWSFTLGRPPMVLKGSYDVIPEFRLTHADGTRNDNAVFATVLVELSEIIGDISSEVSRPNVRTRDGADYEISVLRALYPAIRQSAETRGTTENMGTTHPRHCTLVSRPTCQLVVRWTRRAHRL